MGKRNDLERSAYSEKSHRSPHTVPVDVYALDLHHTTELGREPIGWQVPDTSARVSSGRQVTPVPWIRDAPSNRLLAMNALRWSRAVTIGQFTRTIESQLNGEFPSSLSCFVFTPGRFVVFQHTGRGSYELRLECLEPNATRTRDFPAKS